MLFLGIDQSLRRPGVAVLDDGGRVIVADALSVSEALSGGAALDTICRFVLNTLRRGFYNHEGPIKACIEGPNLNAPNPQTLFALGEVSGAIKAALWAEHYVVPTVVAPGQLKKFAGVKDQSDKAKVLHAVKTLWGEDFGDEDDVADAYVLARIALAMSKETFDRRCEADVAYALLGTGDKPPVKPRKKRALVRKTENL